MNFPAFLWGIFLKFGSVVTTYNSYKVPYLIYLEESQITEYRKNRLNNLDFLPIQNVRQYRFHDMTMYEKISPKESISIKEFSPK